MDEETIAEEEFIVWFDQNIRPRARLLGFENLNDITFEVIFPEERKATGVFYGYEDWEGSITIIFPDNSCMVTVLIVFMEENNSYSTSETDSSICRDIAYKLDEATGNLHDGFKSYSAATSKPAQAVLRAETQRAVKQKSPIRRLVHFLAIIAVFQEPLFWITDTEDDGKHFKRLLAPLTKIYGSLMLLSNSALGIDEQGRTYLCLAVDQFAKSVSAPPSPLHRDGVALNWALHKAGDVSPIVQASPNKLSC